MANINIRLISLSLCNKHSKTRGDALRQKIATNFSPVHEVDSNLRHSSYLV
jgi:hypothetical protein